MNKRVNKRYFFPQKQPGSSGLVGVEELLVNFTQVTNTLLVINGLYLPLQRRHTFRQRGVAAYFFWL